MQIAVAPKRDERDRTLRVRKHGAVAVVQPGGTIEAGEARREALSWELREELLLAVARNQLQYLGRAQALAANEPGVRVAAEIFGLRIDRPIAVRAEGQKPCG